MSNDRWEFLKFTINNEQLQRKIEAIGLSKAEVEKVIPLLELAYEWGAMVKH